MVLINSFSDNNKLILHAEFTLYNFLFIAGVFFEILDVDILVRSQKWWKTDLYGPQGWLQFKLTSANLYLQQVFS